MWASGSVDRVALPWLEELMTLHLSKPLKNDHIIKGLEARIEVSLKEDLAQIAFLSIRPDLISKSRLKAEINYNKEGLILNLRGKDISQLRAGMNSYLRLIGMIVELFEVLKE